MKAAGSEHGSQQTEDREQDHVRLRVAEWFSFGLSLLLLLGLTGYRIWRATVPTPRAIPVTAPPLLEEATPVGEGFVMPVQVTTAAIAR
jgi:hypothetical protein